MLKQSFFFFFSFSFLSSDLLFLRDFEKMEKYFKEAKAKGFADSLSHFVMIQVFFFSFSFSFSNLLFSSFFLSPPPGPW